MKLFAGEYTRVDYLEDSSVIETVWMPRSGELTLDEVKAEMLRFLKFVHEKKPLAVIADTRYFGVKVDKELQNWIVLNYMSEIMEDSVKKYAILVTEEHYPKVAKGSEREEYSDDFQVKYFTSHAEAFRWASRK